MTRRCPGQEMSGVCSLRFPGRRVAARDRRDTETIIRRVSSVAGQVVFVWDLPWFPVERLSRRSPAEREDKCPGARPGTPAIISGLKSEMQVKRSRRRSAAGHVAHGYARASLAR